MTTFRTLFLKFLVVSSFLVTVSPSQAIEFIAHRGESFDAPENTMAAFRLAWERKVRAVELDVHLTKDNRLVVIHDADTKRTAGETLAINNSTFDQLRHLDVGAWKNPRWKGERLPTLEEALETIPPATRCFIEVKVGPEAVPPLVKAIQQCGKSPEQLCIISFKAPTIAEAKKRLPSIKAYYLSGFERDKVTKQWSPTIDQLIAKAKSIQADGLDLSYKGPINRDEVQKIKSAGLEVYVYTIDDAKVAAKFAQMGVDGITTNRAEWLEKQLNANAVPAAQ